MDAKPGLRTHHYTAGWWEHMAPQLTCSTLIDYWTVSRKINHVKPVEAPEFIEFIADNYFQWYICHFVGRKIFGGKMIRFSSSLAVPRTLIDINNSCWYLIMKVNSELKINNYVIEIWINLLNMVKILSDSDNSLSRVHHDWAQISNSLHFRQTDWL